MHVVVVQSFAMAEESEVYLWVKSLSPSLKIERLSSEFENRGFRSRRSLAYVKTDDLDTFFPSPSKLLLAERRILEAELNNIKAENHRQPTQLEPKRLNYIPSASTAATVKETSQPYFPEAAADNIGLAIAPNQSPQILQSPLDRRAIELSENRKLLEVQVESAKRHLQGKQKALDDFPNAHERRGKVCAICHTSGHNRSKCNKSPCHDVNLCKLKDKHPELLNDIRTLQRDLKELEQKYAKAKSECDVFNASRQRAKSSFFAIMRPRLRKQNPAKYLERAALDRDLMILQRALKNKVPLDERDDWRLPNVIEEYKHGIVEPLRVQ